MIAFSQSSIWNCFHDLISHVQGEGFSVQAAHVSAFLTLGQERTLPLITLEGYLGLKMRRELHQRVLAPHHGQCQELLFTAMWSLAFPRWGEGQLPMGSPYFGVAPQVEKTLSFLLRSLCFPCFKFLKLISCNCFVLFLLQQIYLSWLQLWERFNSAG